MTNQRLLRRSSLYRYVRRTAWLLAMVGMVFSRGHSVYATGENHIQEIMAGANGDARAQFIVIRTEPSGNCWGPQGSEQQAREMLVFEDALGRETGRFKFPSNPGNASDCNTFPNHAVLIATQEFADLPGAPAPDFILPRPMVNANSGQVCYVTNPLNNQNPRTDCVSYGSFSGNTQHPTTLNLGGERALKGPPAAALPIMGTVSLKTNSSAATNASFSLLTTPTPINLAGATFVIPAATSIVQGENVFTRETFSGNGRSCATCHVASNSFGMFPSNIQSRFATLASTFDPLFIGEVKPSAFDAGFDFNLNTLDLVPSALDASTGVASNKPCIGELRGTITGTTGSARVIARVSGTKYLVAGGMSPALSGTISDAFSCSGTFGSITAGDLAKTEASGLNGLELPRKMRTSTDGANFPQGRSLILENVDGTGPPLSAQVFRKSPHLLNLSHTAPFGFSGDVPNLQAFLRGAINQHYPRTLARNFTGTNPDSREATVAEVQAAQAFVLAQEFPPGTDPNKFDLDRFATTDAQQRGRALFFGAAKCSMCHGGPVLAATTASIQGKAIGINAAFNTGVVNQLINGPAQDNLPPEAGGTREFSTPQLFNVRNLTPLFHDASAPTVAAAVEFYSTTAFNNSPAGVALGGISLSGQDKLDLTEFLNGLTPRPYSLSTSRVFFGARDPAAGPTGAATITLTNTSSAAISVTACTLTGLNPGEFQITACPVPALAPSASIQVQVTFDPTAIGLKAATLEFTVGSNPSGVLLFGQGGALGTAPSVTSFTPTSGSTLGGTPFTITGTGFLAGAKVTVGGTDAGNVVVVDSKTITAVTPPGAGAVAVVVTNPDGQPSTAPQNFTYLAPPQQTLMNPSSGSGTGGTNFTITGSGFVAGATVNIGGVLATNIVVNGPGTSITGTTPAHAAGVVDVVVTNPNSLTSLSQFGFTFTSAVTTGIITIDTESIPNARLDPTETVTVSLCVGNPSAATTGDIVGTLRATGGVQSPSTAKDFGTIANTTPSCRQFTFTVNASCGNTVSASLQTTENGEPKTLVFTLPVGTSATVFSQNFDAVSPPALPAGWTTTTLSGAENPWVTSASTPDSAPNKVFANNLGTSSGSVLVTPTIAIPASASQLTFRHSFNLETAFDGGVLEISINNAAFEDIITAGGSFVTNGYNGLVLTLANRPGWTGDSDGYVTTTVNLPAGAQGQNIKLRWLIANDLDVGGAGWSVDTVVVTASQCGPGVPNNTNLLQNPMFAGGIVPASGAPTRWLTFSSPGGNNLESDLSNGVFKWRRVAGPGGQPASQGVIFQETGISFPANTPLLAQFDLANTSSARKYMKVLLVGNPSFDDVVACTFQLAANSPMQTYKMKGHTTKAVSNMALYFYASSTKTDEGFYQVDNTSLEVDPTQPADIVHCLDPVPHVGTPGAPDGPNLLTNGDFASGQQAPWNPAGSPLNIRTPIVGNVLEFTRTTLFPPSLVLQSTGQVMTPNQIMKVTLQLGNSSNVRKRALLIAHDVDFSDLRACTWWLEPGQAMSMFSMSFYAFDQWENATVAVYASTLGAEQWYRLDNVTLQRTPGATTVGVECAELGLAPFADTLSAQSNATDPPLGLVTAAPAASAGGTSMASGDGTGAAAWTQTAAGWEVTATTSGPATRFLDDPIDLTDAASARLTFSSRLSAAGGSQGEVQVSLDDGSTWITVDTVPPSDDLAQLEVDLDAFIGEIVDVRFVFDGVAAASGAAPDTWQVADVVVQITPAKRRDAADRR